MANQQLVQARLAAQTVDQLDYLKDQTGITSTTHLLGNIIRQMAQLKKALAQFEDPELLIKGHDHNGNEKTLLVSVNL